MTPLILSSHSLLIIRPYVCRYGHDHEETARHLVAVGKMYQLLFDIETATKYFVRALAIYCDHVGVMNLGTGAACKAMGVCLITMGDVEQASHYRAWAVEIFTKCLGTHCETVRAIFAFGQSMAEHQDLWYGCFVFARHLTC